MIPSANLSSDPHPLARFCLQKVSQFPKLEVLSMDHCQGYMSLKGTLQFQTIIFISGPHGLLTIFYCKMHSFSPITKGSVVLQLQSDSQIQILFWDSRQFLTCELNTIKSKLHTFNIQWHRLSTHILIGRYRGIAWKNTRLKQNWNPERQTLHFATLCLTSRIHGNIIWFPTALGIPVPPVLLLQNI